MVSRGNELTPATPAPLGLTFPAGIQHAQRILGEAFHTSASWSARVKFPRAWNHRFVQLLAHLTDEDIRRYVAGARSAEADRHVRTCVCCALRLADAALRAVWWERRGVLARLVRVDSSQAVDELLADIAREQRRDAA